MIDYYSGTVTLGGIAGAYENATTATEGTTVAAEENKPATYYETVTETIPNDSITTYDDYGNEIKTEQGFVNRTVKKTYEVNTTEPTDDNSSENPDGSSNENTEESDVSLGNKYIYQDVNVDRAGVMFNIAGEAKADSVPLSNENRTYGIALNIYYKNNTVPETHYQEFNAATTLKQTDNNPITRIDGGGEFWHIAIGAVIGGLVNTVAAIVTNIVSGNNWYNDIGVAALSGMASGALAATGVGIFGSILGNAAIGGVTEFANQAISNNGFDAGKIASETLFGGIAGAIGENGFGSKHLNTAGKQATKRVTNAVKNKTSGGIKKAVVNYAKNTKTILTREVKKSIISPTIYTTILKTILIGGKKISLTYNLNLGHCNHA